MITINNPALLVIDLQRWFLEVGSSEKLAAVETLISQTNTLIDFFYERKLPIIHIHTVHQADGSTWNQWMKEHNSPRLIEGTREAEEHPGVHKYVTDIQVIKSRHSAFIRTQLESILRDRQVDTLIMAGFSTNACVGLTAIDAYERDFKVVIAAEAILGTNLVQGNLMLDYLRNRFEVVPTPSTEIMDAISASIGA